MSGRQSPALALAVGRAGGALVGSGEAVSAFPAPCQRVRHAGAEPQLVEMIAGQFIANNHPYCCVCYKPGCSTVMFSGLIMFAFGLSYSLGKQFSCIINVLI